MARSFGKPLWYVLFYRQPLLLYMGVEDLGIHEFIQIFTITVGKIFFKSIKLKKKKIMILWIVFSQAANKI